MPVALVDTPNGQIRVETGTGRVTKIDRDAGARNAHIVIDAAPKLRDPVTAWADMMDPNVEGQVELVRAAGLPSVIIEYRIETHRKPGQPVDLPLEKIPTRERVRDLCILRPADDSGDAPGASSDDPSPEPQVHREGTVVEPASTAPQERPPVADEREPVTLRDAMGLALACTTLAYRLLAKRYASVTESAEVERRVDRLAGVFVDVCKATSSPHHAPSALEAVLGARPLPFEAAEQQAWREQIATDTKLILATAVGLIERSAA